MTFHSILFEDSNGGIKKGTREQPDVFVDLNLDQVVDTITAGRQEYNLRPFFYTSLTDVGTIEYRHEIFRDLENTRLFETIKSFAQNMRIMRDHLAQAEKLYYRYQKERWFVEAVEIYCDAVNCLVQDLLRADLKSRGFVHLRDYVATYAQSGAFASPWRGRSSFSSTCPPYTIPCSSKGPPSRSGNTNRKVITA